MQLTLTGDRYVFANSFSDYVPFSRRLVLDILSFFILTAVRGTYGMCAH